jgi:hypothetical protein
MTREEQKELADLRAMRDRILKLTEPEASSRAFREWEAAGYPSHNSAPAAPNAPTLRVISGAATTTEPTRRDTLRLVP